MSETLDDLEIGSLTLQDAMNADDLQSAEDFCALNSEAKMVTSIEAEAFKSIKLIGYQGALLAENDFKKALEEGPKNIEYTKLVNFLTNELRTLCNLDECVNAITTPEDSVSFIMETSSFLNELGCPYPTLTQGHVSDRLSTVQDRALLLEHLVTEIMAARILRENRPEKKIELKLQESPQAADLRKILQILGFSKPPSNITMQTLMQKVIPTVQNTVQKAHVDLIGNPIFNGTLSEKQWESLSNVQQELHDDYLIRREMLLKRLDCTIQSFQWSDKTKGKDSQFEKAYSEKRKLLKSEPEVDLSDLLTSRDDLAVIEKTSNASVRKNTKSSINKVIIGQVPDRGGRTSEQAPPPPEMPPWQQRSAGPSGRGNFRGGQQGGSRGRGQQSNYGGGNNYSQGGNSYSQSGNNYSQGGNSYSQGGSNYAQGNYSSYSNDTRGGSAKSFDSAGSYGGNSAKGDYSRSNDYSRGGNDYSRGATDYSRGGNDYSRGATDYSRGGNDYSRGGNDYSRDSSDYSRGSNDYSRGGNDYSKGSGNYSQSSGGYSQGGGGYSRGSFDSAGSYGGYSQDYQEPKRAKTYDQFQQSKTSYADQYVQESQHNQQYHSRDRDNRSRGGRGGRSNYNRGGGRDGYR